MKRQIFIFLIFVAAMLAGCKPGSQEAGETFSTPTSGKATQIVLPSETLAPAWADTALPSQISPTTTPAANEVIVTEIRQPEETLLPTITPLPWSTHGILPEHVARLEVLQTWGKGSVRRIELIAKGQLLVAQTLFGLHIYHQANMDLATFLEGAREFFISPDEQWLVTRFSDGVIGVYNLPSFEQRFVFQPLVELPYYAVDRLKLLSGEEYVRQRRAYIDQFMSLAAVGFAHNEKTLAIAFVDGTLGAWSLEDGKLLSQVKDAGIKQVQVLAFTPDGSVVVVGSGGEDISAWRLSENKLSWWQGQAGQITDDPFSFDGSLLLTKVEIAGSQTAYVILREMRFGREVGRMLGRVAENALSPDNSLLLTTWRQEVTVWSVPGMGEKRRINTGLDWPRASFSADGKQIMINGGEQIWQVVDFRLVTPTVDSLEEELPPIGENAAEGLTAHTAYERLHDAGHWLGMQGIKVLSSNQALVWGLLDQDVLWWQELLAGEYHKARLPAPLLEGQLPAISPSGKFVAACTQAGLVLVYLQDGKQRLLDRCRMGGALAISRDEETIFRGRGALIEVVEIKSGKVLFNIVGHTLSVESLFVTPDGAYLVSASVADEQVTELFLWRLKPITKVRQFALAMGGRLTGTVVSDSRGLLFVGLGGLHIFRLGDGMELPSLRLTASSLALTQDELLLITGEPDGSIHFYSVGDDREAGVLNDDGGAILALAVTPDGNNLLSLSAEGIVRLWGVK